MERLLAWLNKVTAPSHNVPQHKQLLKAFVLALTTCSVVLIMLIGSAAAVYVLFEILGFPLLCLLAILIGTTVAWYNYLESERWY